MARKISGKPADGGERRGAGKLQIGDGGKLEHAAEVDDLGELFSGELCEAVEIFSKRSRRTTGRSAVESAHYRGDGWECEIKRAVGDSGM